MGVNASASVRDLTQHGAVVNMPAMAGDATGQRRLAGPARDRSPNVSAFRARG
jgi:hypothetical protein